MKSVQLVQKTFYPLRNKEALLFALAAFILIQFSLKRVGVSADAITYTSVSRNLNASWTLRPFDGDVLVDFPVGYPLFLAFIQFVTRMDPFAFGLLLNGVLFGLLIYTTQCLLRAEDVPLPERLLCGTCLVFSPALLEVFEMLWSETLFLVLLGLFIAACVHYGKTYKAGALWVMALIAALACVVRYAGLTLVLTGGLLILCDRGPSFGKRFKNALLFGVVSISLLACNLIRNWLISGVPTGDRKRNFLPLATHLHRFGAVLSGWLPILHHYPILYTGVTVLFIAAITAAFGFFWIRRREALSVYAVSTAFCIVYSAFILAIALLTEFEGLDTRLLSPLYFPALIGVLGWIHHTAMILRPSAKAGSSGAVPPIQLVPSSRWMSLTLAFLLAGNILLDANNMTHPEIAYKNYIRYDMSALAVSPTLQYVHAHAGELGQAPNVYSNAPDLMYELGALHTDYLPDVRDGEDRKAFQDDQGAYLIWINACLAYPMPYLDSIRRIAPLKLVQTFPDGAVYIRN